MNLSAPKMVTWLVALALGAVGLLLQYKVISIAALAPHSLLLLAAGWALLVVASAVRGL